MRVFRVVLSLGSVVGVRELGKLAYAGGLALEVALLVAEYERTILRQEERIQQEVVHMLWEAADFLTSFF